MELVKVNRALISVWRKNRVLPLAEELLKHNIEIVTTGGTASFFEREQIPHTLVREYTRAPEMLGGRVKTLHPMIQGGILACRGIDQHKYEIDHYNIPLFELVIVDLYPFTQDEDLAEAIELIDIGGVTLLRAAAKNFFYVAPVHAKAYEGVIQELRDYNGCTTYKMRRELARSTFILTAEYDKQIAEYFKKGRT